MYSSCNADDAAAAVPWEQRRTSGTLEAGSELRYAGKKGGSVYTMGEILIRVPEKGGGGRDKLCMRRCTV